MAILRLLPGEVELAVHEGESILQATVRDGFSYRFGCRRGGCGICKADLVSGEVRYGKNIAESVLSEQERAEGVVLTCRAQPATDEVVVRLRPGHRLKLNVPLLLAAAQQRIAGVDDHRSTADVQGPEQFSTKEA
ncbi:2Fe-2S iron-sulfur cluster-binding protein [Mycolicibacter icosiumassiliensis]|uniref:2Fe-2S iron-sulfur cluster-binding protein n=1 Tax=Mycolicibacter icosiumassiliensis TaxID=1792835 RepID=UPI000990303B|nr:2Fe-2S iron-sulfur cluster-binding protein [Mycolicibacter icosiumassiliensis]